MAKMDCCSVREKYYLDIPMTEFERVVSFDPTRKDGKMGLYSKFLLSLYRRGVEIPDDTMDILCKFDALKPNLKKRDIGTYRNFDEIRNVLNDFKVIPIGKQAAAKAAKRNGAELVIDNEYCRAYRLLTAEAARIYGENTKWCTVTEGNYKNYTKDGYLFVLIPHDNPNEGKVQLYTTSFGADKRYDYVFRNAQDKLIEDVPSALDETINSLLLYSIFTNAGDMRFDGAVYHMDGDYPNIPIDKMELCAVSKNILM